ncbi:uncharacterized protein LY89DRAFT_668725 [Mollisia scopiformis]|uniref:2EXR domain-containing protein n=1 Tax=Mollisia scopiformis TaxID=149040 RepID=A0A194XCB9_MOLSC|nr:uncharacterized protein LY89DRAFT_668725 [Mollisia scopiformis]KUJ17397.1 hypothetical protein LY89DRAFT_668725 [Mollisia scopiformis]
MKLPIELRHAIWVLARPEARVVKISLSKARPTFGELQRFAYTKAKVPNLLHACSESRQVALKWYTIAYNKPKDQSLFNKLFQIALRRTVYPPIYLDVKADFIYLHCRVCKGEVCDLSTDCGVTSDWSEKSKSPRIICEQPQYTIPPVLWFHQIEEIFVATPGYGQRLQAGTPASRFVIERNGIKMRLDSLNRYKALCKLEARIGKNCPPVPKRLDAVQSGNPPSGIPKRPILRGLPREVRNAELEKARRQAELEAEDQWEEESDAIVFSEETWNKKQKTRNGFVPLWTTYTPAQTQTSKEWKPTLRR